MRAFSFMLSLVIVGLAATCVTGEASSREKEKTGIREQCTDFGFKEGTDAFANCMLQLSLEQRRHQPPDRETLLRRYKNLSMARRGDDRYPVCTASMMDNELDTSINKWVGPNCQMAPD
jgi:hypothetical protein